MNEALPDLEGKIVYAYVGSLSSGWSDGITLEECALREMGGRTFLVGRTVDGYRPEWTPGPIASVAWDEVTAFVAYPTREAFVAAMDRAIAEGNARSPGLFDRIFRKS